MPKLPKNSFYLISGILFVLILAAAGIFVYLQNNTQFFKNHPKVTVTKDEGKKDTSPVKTAFSAQVISINGQKLVVKNINDQKNYNVSLTGEALVTSNGSTSSLANIKVGDNVQIYSKTTSTIDPNKTFYSEWVDIQAPLDLSNVKTTVK